MLEAPPFSAGVNGALNDRGTPIRVCSAFGILEPRFLFGEPGFLLLMCVQTVGKRMGG
jgi:hypothetical protein